jgi:hypothetical protein
LLLSNHSIHGGKHSSMRGIASRKMPQRATKNVCSDVFSVPINYAARRARQSQHRFQGRRGGGIIFPPPKQSTAPSQQPQDRWHVELHNPDACECEELNIASRILNQ